MGQIEDNGIQHSPKDYRADSAASSLYQKDVSASRTVNCSEDITAKLTLTGVLIRLSFIRPITYSVRQRMYDETK
ncbi:hypothetical protein NEOLEDRAFT_1133475 [Neolentinus lepideus HHB14362 ss-1]|uniref:Uncharacterized protein n=1 Tax=Neolentinus lepideus HHB14362 ss-1 TaxID=1314782 RepID=A0A165SQF1_9AGAM|nr:hypothetical protein NEOLEDRAFT_1133475 [Neolentinus lepideus HHB14362 ss-1]